LIRIEGMNRRAKKQLIAAMIMLTLAAAFFFNSWRASRAGPQAFFYDLSKRELFTANANLIPPIRGIDNTEEDGVKAVVIAPTPNDKKNRRIAYLERFSPELKRDMEEARANQTRPLIDRGSQQNFRFVRRAQDSNWYPMNSPEGQRIVNEWTTPGPDGLSPVVCTP
jgi:hypothetical protein